MAALAEGGTPLAVKLVPKKWTIPAAGSATLASILGYTRATTWIRAVTMRAARLNSANVEWGDGTAERGGFLEPGEAANIDWGEDQTFAEDFTLHGAAGDIVYLSVDVNRYYFEHPGS